MVNPAAILAAVAAAVFFLSNTAHAHSKDSTIQGAGADDAQPQRFLRAALVVEEGSQEHADEEDAAFGNDNSAGHAPPSADAGHDGKMPAQHDRNDKPRDKKTDGPHHPPSNNRDHDHGHRHHDASSSSSMAGHHDAGHHAAVSMPPSQHHAKTKEGDKYPGKEDVKPCDHQHHNPADVGYGGKSPRLDSKKDVAHDHGHGSSDASVPTHKAAKSAKLASASAGSADAYLFTKHVGSPRSSK